MTDTIIYRELHTIDDLNRVFDLEIVIWDMSPGDAVPAALLISVTGNGGVVIGAEDEGELVGFAFGIPARHDDHWWLWSYMAGVAPGYQAQGIGVGLKAAQREWALEHGYTVVRWTFDPMQRANANFNFRKLGVTAERYHINRYGTMTDGLNAGMQSDRLEVTWHLNDPAVSALMESRSSPQPPDDVDMQSALVRFEQGQVASTPLDDPQSQLYIEIPADLAMLKRAQPELAQQWQLAMRTAFTEAFASGYFASQIMISHNGRHWYRLTRRESAKI